MRASVLSAGIPVNREAAFGFFLHLLDFLLGLVSLFLHVGLHLLLCVAGLFLRISDGFFSLLFGVVYRLDNLLFCLVGLRFGCLSGFFAAACSGVISPAMMIRPVTGSKRNSPSAGGCSVD